MAGFTLGDYAREESRKLVESQSEMQSLLGNVRSNLDGGKLKEASEFYGRARGKGEVVAGVEFKQLEKDLQKAQARNLFQAQQQVVAINAPAAQPQAAPPQGVQYDELAAEQQWLKLQQAQEVTAARTLPLRVNLPKRGLRYAFTQVLQTEVGQTMTVRFAANNTQAMGWPLRMGLGLGGFVVVWAAEAAAASGLSGRAVAHDLADDEQRFLDAERFGDEPVDGVLGLELAQSQSIDSGAEDHFDLGIEFTEPLERLGAVQSGHVIVQQHQFDILLDAGVEFQRLDRVGDRSNLVSDRFEHFLDDVAELFVVIDDHHPHGPKSRGRSGRGRHGVNHRVVQNVGWRLHGIGLPMN